ncbi:MAG: hypothetical protein ACTSV6_03080 [Candidatus Heimdallarchaeota archaeon]
MSSKLKAKSKELLKLIKKETKSSPLFYTLLEDITFELKPLAPKVALPYTKKLAPAIPVMLELLVKEPNENYRLSLLAFFRAIPLEYLAPELFTTILKAIIEALHWDGNQEVKEEASKILFDHLVLTREVQENPQRAIVFYQLLFEEFSSLEEILQEEVNGRIKIRLTALFTLLARNLFSSSFQEIPFKSRVAIFRRISVLIPESYQLPILDYARKMIINSLPAIFQSLLELIPEEELRFDLIDSFLSRLLDAHDSLPIIYQEMHLSVLYKIASLLGEQYASKVIFKYLQLLETCQRTSHVKIIENFLAKLAREFNYGYRNKLIAYYQPLLKKYKEQKEGAVLSFKKTIPRNCYWCGTPVETQATVCPSCGKELLRCVICKLPISFEDDVGACSFCEAKGHLTHFEEWVKSQGKCPSCLRDLPLEGIVQISKNSSK